MARFLEASSLPRQAQAVRRFRSSRKPSRTERSSEAHAFELTCARNNIEHRTTKAKHPWTNGKVERMNRSIKDAAVKRYSYESHEQLRQHLNHFVSAYNYGRRLKTLKGLTPYEFSCKKGTTEPLRFNLNPL